jgi:tRNA U34 2-thiouridine synthase MnmA/TrmU
LQTYLPTQQGDIVDENGQFIKHHQGLAFYTIGQRKGLEIGGGFGTSGAPWFVADKRKPFSVAIFRTSFLLISPNGNRLFESWCWFKRCRK